MSTPVLQLQGIHKRFPGVYALRGVSLDVRAGEVLALLGENGAGKSTLMKVVGGIEQPDAGDIVIDGARVVINDVRAAAARGIAFIHQELNLLDNLDVAGNVLLGREPTSGGRLRLVDRQAMRRIVRPLLDQLGLDVSPDTPVARLSIAQQQLVEIAKALSLDARVVIMDEPTSSLTLAETQRLHDVVSRLRSRGVAVIYITHRLTEVQTIADRAVVLRDGSNAGALAQDELTHSNMVRLMVGRDIVIGHRPPESPARKDYCVVEGLRTQRYPRHAVSLTVGHGEILGVAGLVGAGRSELARAIFGIEPPVAGTMRLDGILIGMADPAEAIRRGVCLVPEDRRSAGLVVDFSIGVRAATLSGGNQQKVVLAKWLALGPKVLIVDEPTRGIDVGAKAEIYALLRGLAASGVSIVMISSDMEEILRLSDRVAVMHEGRISGVIEGAHCTEERIMALAVGEAASVT
jgi:ribose transport system ATP-binding protein